MRQLHTSWANSLACACHPPGHNVSQDDGFSCDTAMCACIHACMHRDNPHQGCFSKSSLAGPLCTPDETQERGTKYPSLEATCWPVLHYKRTNLNREYIDQRNQHHQTNQMDKPNGQTHPALVSACTRLLLPCNVSVLAPMRVRHTRCGSEF